jgi:hypothetical protein
MPAPLSPQSLSWRSIHASCREVSHQLLWVRIRPLEAAYTHLHHSNGFHASTSLATIRYTRRDCGVTQGSAPHTEQRPSGELIRTPGSSPRHAPRRCPLTWTDRISEVISPQGATRRVVPSLATRWPHDRGGRRTQRSGHSRADQHKLRWTTTPPNPTTGSRNPKQGSGDECGGSVQAVALPLTGGASVTPPPAFPPSAPRSCRGP